MFARGSEGLAQRMIVQSGACLGAGDGFALNFTGAPRSREQLTATSGALIDDLCGPNAPDPIACLRALDADTLVGWQPPDLDQLGFFLVEVLFKGFNPYVDGELIPARLIELLRTGQFQQLPSIVGTTQNEWELFALFLAEVGDRDAFSASIRRLYRANTERILAHYLPESDRQARAAWLRLFGDHLFRCPARALVRALGRQGNAAYVYRFAVPPAAHAQDVDYLFASEYASLALPAAPLPLLSGVVEALPGYWTHFARSGDPNAAADHSWRWPSYTEREPKHLVFAESLDLDSDSARAELDCDFWDELYPDEFR